MADNFTPLPPVTHPLAGNTYAMKYKTSEERKGVCLRFCEYLKTGKPKNYFPECDYDTIQRYSKDFPEDFPIDAIEEAMRAGRNYLLNIGYAGMLGKVDGFKEKTWQFIIQNMTDWRLRQDITTKDEAIKGPTVYLPKEVDE